jgi:hypothetical protein
MEPIHGFSTTRMGTVAMPELDGRCIHAETECHAELKEVAESWKIAGGGESCWKAEANEAIALGGPTTLVASNTRNASTRLAHMDLDA